MSLDIARVHWGSCLIFVCQRESLPQTRPLDDPDWLVGAVSPMRTALHMAILGR